MHTNLFSNTRLKKQHKIMFKKPKSIEEMIGMADSFIGMATAGKSSVESLSAEYLPKLIEMVKGYENAESGSSLMLTLMLDERKTFLVASIFELSANGLATPKAAFPINSLKDIIEIFKNVKNDAQPTDPVREIAEPVATEQNQQPEPGADSNGSDEHSGGTESNGAGTGADTDGGNDGLPENLDGAGAPPFS
jgi:hypothetical protein